MLPIHLHLDLPSGLFSSGFPTNKLYAFLFSPIRATWPTHLILILIDFIILIILLQASIENCTTIIKTFTVCAAGVTAGFLLI
jgi:hypothetical protein